MINLHKSVQVILPWEVKLKIKINIFGAEKDLDNKGTIRKSKTWYAIFIKRLKKIILTIKFYEIWHSFFKYN